MANRAPWRATPTDFTPIVCMLFHALVKLHTNEIFFTDEFPNQISPWNKPTELSCIILYDWKVSSIWINQLLSALKYRIRTFCHNHCRACLTDILHRNLPRVEPEKENLIYVVSFSYNTSYLVIVSDNNETAHLVSIRGHKACKWKGNKKKNHSPPLYMWIYSRLRWWRGCYSH